MVDIRACSKECKSNWGHINYVLTCEFAEQTWFSHEINSFRNWSDPCDVWLTNSSVNQEQLESVNIFYTWNKMQVLLLKLTESTCGCCEMLFATECRGLHAVERGDRVPTVGSPHRPALSCSAKRPSLCVRPGLGQKDHIIAPWPMSVCSPVHNFLTTRKYRGLFFYLFLVCLSFGCFFFFLFHPKSFLLQSCSSAELKMLKENPTIVSLLQVDVCFALSWLQSRLSDKIIQSST